MPEPTWGARLTSFTKDMVDRIAGIIPGAAPRDAPIINGIKQQPAPTNGPQAQPRERVMPVPPGPAWFGPGQPMNPTAPRSDVAGRAFDYPTTYNMGTQVRAYEGTSFAALRAFADWDLVRLAIETRKDQMSKLEWSVLPVRAGTDELRGKPDARCREVESFFKFPDRRNTWHAWQRLLMEDCLAIDAPAIYVRRDMGGRVYSLEAVDGSTIRPLIDMTGRQPEAPAAAYQQILKGLSAVEYTADELLYVPRNPRPGHIYGMGIPEQILITINVAIRRDVARMSYFAEGNIPEALIGVPKDWTPDMIERFQQYWDTILADPAGRRRARFVPGDMHYQPTRNETSMTDAFDEWIARVVAYAFSLPPTPFVKMTNRSVAEQSYATSLEEGLAPMMLWYKGVMDRIIQRVFGYTDLEFSWNPIDKLDAGARGSEDRADMGVGLTSIDEIRASRGLAPYGIGPFIMGGPNGVIFLDELKKAKEAGLLAIGQPMQPPGMDPNMMPPGDAGYVDGSAPQQMIGQAGGNVTPPADVSRALAGIPQSLLAAVGLGPNGASGRIVDVYADEEEESDPLSEGVSDPQVLRTLREVERMRGRVDR